MKTLEFIEMELKMLAKSEIEQSFNGVQVNAVNKKLESIQIESEFSNIDEIINTIQRDEQLSSLSSTKWFLEQMKKCNDEITIESVVEIERQIQQAPKNKLLPLLWIDSKIQIDDQEESLGIEAALFLNTVFDKYGYLIALEDFFEKTGLLGYEFMYDKMHVDIFAPVLENAIKKYPQKIALKKLLGLIYFKNQNYQESSRVFHEILSQVKEKEADRDDFYDHDLYNVILNLGIIYSKNGNFEKAMEYVSYVISNIPTSFYSEGEQPDILDYIEAFLIRMRINIINHNHDHVKADYKTIKGYLSIDFHGADYGDVFEYINKNMNALKE
jgi:tetratricopeptide (TPR) repeat protein